jgi:hypothetical protein
MTEIRHKALTARDLKVVGPGRVQAAFSVFGNLDLDGDVVVPGAIEDGTEIMVSAWMHGSWTPGVLPLGRGRIRTTASEAIVDATFFDTAAARDTLVVLRGLGDRCQWSFGFTILDSDFTTIDGGRVRLLHRLDVFEASPVLQGSNPLTHTVAVSGDESADEQLAREYARFAAGEFDRQMAAEMADIRAGL